MSCSLEEMPPSQKPPELMRMLRPEEMGKSSASIQIDADVLRLLTVGRLRLTHHENVIVIIKCLLLLLL